MTSLEKGLRDAVYYEERLLQGLWYFRTDPKNGTFFPMNEEQLARKIAAKSFEPRTIKRDKCGDRIA